MPKSDNYKKDPYAKNTEKIPLWLKLVFTFLFIVTIPSNIFNYSAINLLWFCDIAIIIAFLGFWFESSLLISMSALAWVAPQLVWQVDYFFHLLSGKRLFGFSDYMFGPNLSVFSKIVSLFHVWMPYLLLYTLQIVRYNRWALVVQTLTACIALLLSFLLTKDMFGPVGNLNKVYGLSDTKPQTPNLGGAVVMVSCCTGLLFFLYLLTHAFLVCEAIQKERLQQSTECEERVIANESFIS